MRTGILNEVYEQMKQDENIYFMIGDLGFASVEMIEEDFPGRFINAGIAEQNMIGMAAGLALSGKKVYCYSIIPFLIMRCFEQIRNDLCYHNLDVTLLGAGAGMSYGILSSTHFALIDLAITRTLPNFSVFSPADEQEAVLGTKSLKNHHGPAYIRIGQRVEPVIYPQPYDFKLGQGHVLQEGDKDGIVIFGTGPIIHEVILANNLLEDKYEQKVTIIDIHTIKPLDKELILQRSKNAQEIFTVEEHSRIGGLGSSVAETLSESSDLSKLTMIGTDDEFIKEVGSQKYLRKVKGLDAEGILKIIRKQS
jgi:transketolase